MTKIIQTGINSNKNFFCINKSSEPLKNVKTCRVPKLSLVLYIFVKNFLIYLVRQSL